MRINLYRIRPGYILKPRGKNLKLVYYARCFLRNFFPKALLERKKTRLLFGLDARADKAEILERAAYCNKLSLPFSLGEDALHVRDIRNTGTVYSRDSYEILRYFDPALRIKTAFGDNTRVPPEPAVCKSRPIAGEVERCVLLNLDKVRHFVFLHDRIPFREKADLAVFRGACHQPHRKRFMERYFGSALVDCGDTSPAKDGAEHPEWHRPLITLYDHLKYKFILCLEGNDVASNLKWAMSSNSVAVMPRPRYETWFMEGRLVPNYHYIEIKDDFSDLEEKIHYYVAHPEEAEAITRHAHEWIAQFQDPDRELLVSLLVMKKYFELQKPAA